MTMSQLLPGSSRLSADGVRLAYDERVVVDDLGLGARFFYEIPQRILS